MQFSHGVRLFFVNEQLEQLFFSGSIVWKSEEARNLYKMYALLPLGIKPWDVNGGDVYPEDLNYFMRMHQWENKRQNDGDGWKKVSK